MRRGGAERKFLLEKQLANIIKLRYEWSDEIPGQIIHSFNKSFSSDRSKNFKVRGAWWQAIFFSIGNIDVLIEIPPEIKSQIDNLYKKYSGQGNIPKTSEDIAEGNKALDALINFLKQELYI